MVQKNCQGGYGQEKAIVVNMIIYLLGLVVIYSGL